MSHHMNSKLMNVHPFRSGSVKQYVILLSLLLAGLFGPMQAAAQQAEPIKPGKMDRITTPVGEQHATDPALRPGTALGTEAVATQEEAIPAEQPEVQPAIQRSRMEPITPEQRHAAARQREPLQEAPVPAPKPAVTPNNATQP